MKSTSHQDMSVLRTSAATPTLAGGRIASSSLVAGSPSSTDRQARISRVAYYKAQQRDFTPGHEWEDWFAAEREVAESNRAGTVGE